MDDLFDELYHLEERNARAVGPHPKSTLTYY